MIRNEPGWLKPPANERGELMTDNSRTAPAKKPAGPRQTVAAAIQEGEEALTDASKSFLVTYRIKKIEIAGKGGYDRRRDALLERIEALSGEEWHLSTSAWKVKSRRNSMALRDLLSEPLDNRYDFLSVTQVGPTRTFGNAKLES